MNCPMCGKEIVEDSDFCTFCGSDVRQAPAEPAADNTPPPQETLDNQLTWQHAAVSCPVCGKQVIEGSDFCTFCGTNMHLSPAAAAAEYKPVPQDIPDSMKQNNKVAVAALICGAIPVTAIVGFFLALVAIFMIDANRARQKGMNLAVIGGMLSVLWCIVGMVALFYVIGERGGGDFGKTFTKSMKYSQSMQTQGSLNLTLVPADPIAAQRMGPEALKRKLSETSDIIEKRISDSRSAAGVIPSVSTGILILIIPGVKDRQKVIDIVTSTEGMPIALKVINEHSSGPGGMPGMGTGRRSTGPGNSR